VSSSILRVLVLAVLIIPALSCQPENGDVAQKVEPKLSTPTPRKPAQIEWEYVGKYPLVQYEGHPFYQLNDGFFAEIPNDGNMDSRIRVFVPEQYRANGQTAATAAASVTCDVERYVGSKIIELYDGNVIGYQFELKGGTNLLVVPGSRLLKTAILVQTLPGREPIIGIGEVQP
jgi:hypothetical protein